MKAWFIDSDELRLPLPLRSLALTRGQRPPASMRAKPSNLVITFEND